LKRSTKIGFRLVEYSCKWTEI